MLNRLALSSRKNRRTDSGQVTIEAILLIVIFLSVTTMIFKNFRSKETFKKLFTGPFPMLQGMIEDGVWEPIGSSHVHHPSKVDGSNHSRTITVRGDEI